MCTKRSFPQGHLHSPSDATIFWEGKGKEKCPLFWVCYVQHPVLMPECLWRWASHPGVCNGSVCVCYTHRHTKAWVFMRLSTPYCGYGPCLCEPGVQRPSSDSFCCAHVFMRGCSFYLWLVCLSLTEKPCLLYPSHQGEKRIKSLTSGPFSLNAIKQ